MDLGDLFCLKFIVGLKHEIQVYVLQHHPVTQLDAYEFTSIQEYCLHSIKRASEDSDVTSPTCLESLRKFVNLANTLSIGTKTYSRGKCGEFL